MKENNVKNFKNFLNENIIIDGLEYPTTIDKYEQNKKYSRYVYKNNNPDNFNDKRLIRVYNHNTKKHYYLENVEVNVGDNNLLFVDFPRTDAPIDSWSSHSTQYATIRTWGSSRKTHDGDFVRFEIVEFDNDGYYCKTSDGYNEPSGWYARSAFYKINKIS